MSATSAVAKGRGGCNVLPLPNFLIMPIQEYQCSNNHISEELFSSYRTVTETIKCKDSKCRAMAHRIPAHIGYSKMTYGSKYGYATDSDRRDWLKKLHIRGWTGPGT